MAEIYLVRHGQASFTSDDYDRLSDLGRQQSAYLGQYFTSRDISFDHIFTGTQLRHRQTAEAILPGQEQASRFMSHAGLNEYDFEALYTAYMKQHPDEPAAARGANRQIFYQRLKMALTLWSEGRLLGALPEEWTAYRARVADALNHIQDHSDGSCLVVSSGGPISMAVGHMLELAAPKVIDLNLQIKNTSFCHIYFGKNALQLSSFNNIPHLDRDDRRDAITFS